MVVNQGSKKMFFEKWFLPKPYNEGYLPEDNGHKVYFAEYGNKNGKPILIFHGGPGGSCRAKHIKGINLKKYRVIAVEQRGCNRSEPMGEIKNNTTKDLLNDYDRLINHLNINEKIILRGASWGSTLALLWAERNPDKVEKMVLSQIFLANKDFLNCNPLGRFSENRVCFLFTISLFKLYSSFFSSSMFFVSVISRAFLIAGQTFAQTPQPVQSSGDKRIL